ncbi:MAG: hypothetical protein KDD33_09795 [Bdellovibrionales bacterium]|nr:hypothetical protein [Bdellovibrionales bacterium]
MLRLVLLSLLTLTFSSQAMAKCDDSNNSKFCKLWKCYRWTHWNDDKNPADVRFIEDDQNFDYYALIIPSRASTIPAKFTLLQEGNYRVISLPTQKNQLADDCSSSLNKYWEVELDSSCKRLFACWPSSGRKLKVYGKKTLNSRPNICASLAERNEVTKPNTSAVSQDKMTMANAEQIVATQLKYRLEKLVNVINTNPDGVVAEAVLAAVRNDPDPKKAGPCRGFVGGPELNKVEMAIYDKFPKYSPEKSSSSSDTKN